MSQDITLTVDYHDRACVIRRLDGRTGEEQVFTEVPTTRQALDRFVEEARAAAGRRRRVVWIQESTTGWARVRELVSGRVDFHLANVLQMPLPPKGRRCKTDKIDAARIQREHLAGTLPLAYQPPARWRQLRRLVGLRENLVGRRTALRNWIDRYLAHETWVDRTGLWSRRGQQRLRGLLKKLPAMDAFVIGQKLDELARLEVQLEPVLEEILKAYEDCPEAKRLDAISGIDVVSAVSIVARIGPVERSRGADRLIAFAGLAPGIHQSDRTRREGHLGGGGADRRLRHYVIEATMWARKLPRYKPAYDRISKRRGKKVGRVVVGRMLLRSIHKMLKEGVDFDAGAATPVTAAAR